MYTPIPGPGAGLARNGAGAEPRAPAVRDASRSCACREAKTAKSPPAAAAITKTVAASAFPPPDT
eukprot:2689362-Pyramimonas_sp.AAC.1